MSKGAKMEEQLKQQISQKKKIYISLEEIEAMVSKEMSYVAIVNLIKHFICDGILKPVGNKKNGKIPSLFLKYRIVKQENLKISYKNEIKTLCDKLNIEEYLKKPILYEKHRDIVLPLNTFLSKNKEELRTAISKNERAYQIWNDEKMLDNSLCKSIIKWNHLEETLNYYLTPEPFFDYIHTKKEQMNILIIENKDTWYTMRKVMNQIKKDCCFWEQEIDGLVYGEGNKITKLKALEEYETEIVQQKCKFLYWGDLDYTGIEMFERVVAQNPKATIHLFSKMYESMIDKKKIEELGQIKKQQNKKIQLGLFLQEFQIQYQEKIKVILEQDKYIPQEIINASILKQLCKEKGKNLR